jgi:hypothetical protein
MFTHAVVKGKNGTNIPLLVGLAKNLPHSLTSSTDRRAAGLPHRPRRVSNRALFLLLV